MSAIGISFECRKSDNRQPVIICLIITLGAKTGTRTRPQDFIKVKSKRLCCETCLHYIIADAFCKHFWLVPQGWPLRMLNVVVCLNCENMRETTVILRSDYCSLTGMNYANPFHIQRLLLTLDQSSELPSNRFRFKVDVLGVANNVLVISRPRQNRVALWFHSESNNRLWVESSVRDDTLRCHRSIDHGESSNMRTWR